MIESSCLLSGMQVLCSRTRGNVHAGHVSGKSSPAMPTEAGGTHRLGHACQAGLHLQGLLPAARLPAECAAAGRLPAAPRPRDSQA